MSYAFLKTELQMFYVKLFHILREYYMAKEEFTFQFHLNSIISIKSKIRLL